MRMVLHLETARDNMERGVDEVMHLNEEDVVLYRGRLIMD